MSNHHLFSVVGIEIEYMLVDETSLQVQPKSDVILKELAGTIVNEIALGDIAISNELVMHVIELKTNGPKSFDEDIANCFHETNLKLAPILQKHHLKLLPTGAHPLMNPLTDTKRWPYDNKDIYEQYDSIFNCSGHGWSNLQSMHVNLPFANDEEFLQLHSLVRLILPLIPAIAASSPIIDCKPTNKLDTRLDFYNYNQQIIPSISGNIIPEEISSQREYEDVILTRMYRDILPFDPKGLLQGSWLNSRAAIPKFDLMALEIRIIDSQECPNADIAIAKAIHFILKNWHENSDFHLKHTYPTQSLRAVYDDTISHGFSTVIDDAKLLNLWQIPKKSLSVKNVWSYLLERVAPMLDQKSQLALEYILQNGNLSERILYACNGRFDKENISDIYQQIAYSLSQNQQF